MKISVIGLGYVGLPLAIEFSKHYETIGYDIDQSRIDDLKKGNDLNDEVQNDDLKETQTLFTSNEEDLRDSNVYIITVPTPVDFENKPDLTLLKSASKTIGKMVCDQDIVILESTVYPGTTEEICVPIIESESGLKHINCNSKSKVENGFYSGYSPERINPGDKEMYLTKIKKITSGSTPFISGVIDELYNVIIEAGTHKASSIKVAEAAKIIENTQRDVNIALINEFSMIFDRMNIDTTEVIDAASTKWNFNRFSPGMVGGHCIGVDPYYLAHKSIELGHQPEMILSGRRINDNMPLYIADKVISLMDIKGINVIGAKILILGLTFKENCNDIRNSKTFDLIKAFESRSTQVDVYDPLLDPKDIPLNLIDSPKSDHYDAVIITVGHNEFIEIGIDNISGFAKSDHVIFDVKSIFPVAKTDARL